MNLNYFKNNFFLDLRFTWEKLKNYFEVIEYFINFLLVKLKFHLRSYYTLDGYHR